MARYNGVYKAAANYEPQIAAPFDARELVETKADLTSEKTWKQRNGDIWTYVGMVVSVASDVNPANNGRYQLMAADWSNAANWQKMATAADIQVLQEKIDNIEVSGGGSYDIEVETFEDLPSEGDTNATYYIANDRSIWRWSAVLEKYISYGATDLDIEIIYGGKSNGKSN